MKNIFFFLLLSTVAVATAAQETSPVTLPKPKGFVNDFAHVLTAQQKTLLEQKIARFKKETTAEIAIVTVHTTKPYSIEDYTLELSRKWGVGDKERNNGVVILAAISDRRMRIATGTGIEQVLTSERCSAIIANQLRPHFRQAKYYRGFNGAVDEVVQTLNRTAQPVQEDTAMQNTEMLDKLIPQDNNRILSKQPASQTGSNLFYIAGAIAAAVFILLVGKIFWGAGGNTGAGNQQWSSADNDLNLNNYNTGNHFSNDMAASTYSTGISDSNSTDTGSSFDGGSSSGSGSSGDW